MKCRQICEGERGGGVNTEQEKMCKENFCVVNLIAFWGSLLRSLNPGAKEEGAGEEGEGEY